MGKIVGYLGPETIISQAIEGGSYSLTHQAEDCPNGFGVGWYPIHAASNASSPPVRLTSRNALSSDEHLLDVPRHYPSTCILASVQSRHSGPPELSGLQPLRYQQTLFVMESIIENFAGVFLRPLVETLSQETFVRLKGRTPAEVFFALWQDALEETSADGIATALERTVERVQSIATERDMPTALTLTMTDGSVLIALRTATHGSPPPLYTTVTDENTPFPTTARIVASEPIFPGAWQALEPNALTIFTLDSELPESDPEPQEETVSSATH